MYVLVKVYDLVVDGVEAFRTKKQGHRAFREWTEGLTPSQLARREAKNPEEKYSQTQIFEVELEAIDERLTGKWQCDRCLREFKSIERFNDHTEKSRRCRGASAVR